MAIFCVFQHSIGLVYVVYALHIFTKTLCFWPLHDLCIGSLYIIFFTWTSQCFTHLFPYNFRFFDLNNVFFNTQSPIYRWYMYHIFLLKIHVSRHFTAYTPPLHWVIFLPWLLCLWPLLYVDLCTSRLVFINNFSIKQEFMLYRYFHIIFDIFG